MQPGLPLHYATTLTLGGAGCGLLVTSREGRPVKIEGNPDHPASLGASGIYEQAAIYHLLDPRRARTFRRGGRPSSWKEILAAVGDPGASFRRDGGAGLHFLIEPSGSPLLASLRARVLAALPEARFHAFDPLARDAVYEGTRLAFGRPLEAQLDLDRARVIVALDADFLSEGPFRLRYQRRFAGHRVPEGGDEPPLCRGEHAQPSRAPVPITGCASDPARFPRSPWRSSPPWRRSARRPAPEARSRRTPGCARRPRICSPAAPARW